MGDRAKPAQSAIVKMLDHSSHRVRIAAARTLFDLDLEVERAWKSFETELNNADPRVRLYSAKLISEAICPSMHWGCWDVFRPQISSPEWKARASHLLARAVEGGKIDETSTWMAVYLLRIDRNSRAGESALIKSLETEDQEVRGEAIKATRWLAKSIHDLEFAEFMEVMRSAKRGPSTVERKESSSIKASSSDKKTKSPPEKKPESRTSSGPLGSLPHSVRKALRSAESQSSTFTP